MEELEGITKQIIPVFIRTRSIVEAVSGFIIRFQEIRQRDIDAKLYIWVKKDKRNAEITIKKSYILVNRWLYAPLSSLQISGISGYGNEHDLKNINHLEHYGFTLIQRLDLGRD